MDYRTEELRESLRPLYAELIKSVSVFDYVKAFFCMQWGKRFPFENKHGLLFVGRATNGWDSWTNDEITLDGVFDCIFNKSDQMQWVENLEGNDNGYNTNKSAFWRVVKQITQHYHPTNWSSFIAWSNICKVAPGEGNPSDSLYETQIEICQQILKAEINVLSPKVVIFLTGKNWAGSTLRYLNHNESTKSIKKRSWGDFECKVFEIDGVFYLLSEHPQGKPEVEHVQCVIDLLKDLGCEDSM